MTTRQDAGKQAWTTAKKAVLIGVLAMALGLRLWGIGWGLPSATHYWSYHPDESRVLPIVVGKLDLFSGRILPGFYNYPTLQLYIASFLESVAVRLGAATLDITNLAQDHAAFARLFFIARLPTVLMGVGAVWLTEAVGTRLWGRKAGLLAAAFLAVAPLHAQHSHWFTVDVPATFWITLSLYWSARMAAGDVSPTLPRRRKLAPALWAGLAAGFAAATKYNAALVILPAMAAIVATRWPAGSGAAVSSARVAFARAATALVAMVLAFLIGCPGCLLETSVFLDDFRFEAVHVSRQPEIAFQNTGSGFVYHAAVNLYDGLGWPLLLLALAGIAYAVVRRSRGDALLAAFALPYYIVIGIAVSRYARYVIPLLPVLTLWAGRLAADMMEAVQPRVRAAGALASATAFLSALGVAVALIAPMSRTDPRDRAFAWLQAHGCIGQPIGFAAQPWFQTTPVDPVFCSPAPGGWMRSPYTPADWASLYIYRGRDWDSSILTQDKPPVVLLSQYDYRDPLRLGHANAEAFLTVLQRDYRVAAVYGGYANPALDASGPPHDMLYANPATWIFVHK